MKQSYSFDDISPLSDVSYYRLIQTDYDGKYEIFDPVTVKNSKSGSGFRVMAIVPNPFIDNLKVQFNVDTDINLSFELYSLSGNLITNREIPASSGNSEVEFDQVADLPQGIYILKISGNGKILHSERVIKN